MRTFAGECSKPDSLNNPDLETSVSMQFCVREDWFDPSLTNVLNYYLNILGVTNITHCSTKTIVLASLLGKTNIISHCTNICHDYTTVVHAVNSVKCRVWANMVTRTGFIFIKNFFCNSSTKYNISYSVKSPLHFVGILFVYASWPNISFPQNCRLIRTSGIVVR